MPKISIIIPVYNVEKYLERCVNSVLAQTFADFECILIDDGSLDNCHVICDEFARKDERIKVIHQENRGVSAARNAGLDIAQGEWIGFVDSDDWCDPGMYEFLLDNALKHKADISICGYRTVTENNIVRNFMKNHPKLIMNRKEALQKLCINKYINAVPWNKLINKKLFLYENKILRYDEDIKYAEDRLLLYFLFKRANKIIYFPQVYYNYFKRSDSVNMLHIKKGLTSESMTMFDAYQKMLQVETDKAIRYRILTHEGIFAANSCLRYINYNGFIYDEKFTYLYNIVKKNYFYLLFFGSLKQKVYCNLVFFPFIFKLYSKLRRGKI